MELALTSCPGRDLSLPPSTPSCQGSFKAGDLWQKGGGPSFPPPQLQPVCKWPCYLTESKIPLLMS